MTLQSSCPIDDRLNGLLAGRLSEAEQSELSDHLETCSGCRCRLEALAAGSESWMGAVKHLAAAAPERSPLLEQALQRLKDAGGKLETQSEPITFDDLALHFLCPSEQPGQLGCLAHYQVTEVLGRGGMGVVLKAFDPDLQRFVAIKVLAPQLATSEAARKRFAREARTAAAVSHENVVAIYSVEETDGLPYLVMQYIPGISLQERLDRGVPLRVEEIVLIGMNTALGLAAAHAHGLIHRDIKPSNILTSGEWLVGSGEVKNEQGSCMSGTALPTLKITDFGLARAVDDTTLTQSGLLAGTPQYMAPEQARGEPLDYRADLFSFGSVLYALCTGQPPYRADNTMAVLRLVSDGRPASIHELRPDIPDWLAAIIDKLHARNREDRFQSAAEVAVLLGEYLNHLRQPDQVPLPQSSGALKARTKKGTSPMTLIRCSECGNQISDTARTCPHCGARRWQMGYEYRSQATLLGLPWIHVAFGLDPETGRRRVAKGVFALGDVAIGGVAVGGATLGVVSIGGCALGLVSFGGLGVGLLAGLGGMGVGALALGGVALGILALGGAALGWLAAYGGVAVATRYAVGGLAVAEHANDETARQFMDSSVMASGQLLLAQLPWFAVVFAVCFAIAMPVLAKIMRGSSAVLGNRP